MFISIIAIILCLYAVFTPFMYVYCVKMGIRLASNPQKESVKPTIKPKKSRKQEPSEEEKRLQEDFEAINSYNGF